MELRGSQFSEIERCNLLPTQISVGDSSLLQSIYRTCESYPQCPFLLFLLQCYFPPERIILGPSVLKLPVKSALIILLEVKCIFLHSIFSESLDNPGNKTMHSNFSLPQNQCPEFYIIAIHTSYMK